MTHIGKRAALAAFAIFAFMPALFYAYLGTFSRPMFDDFVRIGLPLDIGIWETMLYLRETFNGDYSNFLIFGLLAPLGSNITRVFPLFLILSTILGFSWHINTALSWAQFGARRRLAAALLASLVIPAIIHGFPNRTAIYWYTANVEKYLPVALLLLGIAMAVAASRRLRGGLQLMLAAAATAAISFLIAGFSEMHLVLQLAFTPLIVVYILICQRGPRRGACLILALAACLGAFASLPLQLSSPGIAFRSALEVDGGYVNYPIRDLGLLFGRGLDGTIRHLGNEAGFAGFMLIASAALFVTLTVGNPPRPHPRNARLNRFAAVRSPIALAMIVQLLFIPVLWSHQSDNAAFLGRFSAGFMTIVVIHLVAILALLALLLRRRQLEEWLLSRNRLPLYCSGVLLVVCVLFMLTQFRSVHSKATAYLFVSAAAALLMLAGQLTTSLGNPRLNGLVQISAFCFVAAIITAASQIVAHLWLTGHVFDEGIFAPIFLQAGAGLFCGVALGTVIGGLCSHSDANASWLQWLRLLCFLATATLTIGTLAGPASQASHFQETAHIFDQSEKEILRLRDAGDPEVYTRRFVYFRRANSVRYPSQYDFARLNWGQKIFYDLEYEWPFSSYLPRGISQNEHDDS